MVLSPHLPASLPAGPDLLHRIICDSRKVGFRSLWDNRVLRHRIVAQIGWNNVSAVIAKSNWVRCFMPPVRVDVTHKDRTGAPRIEPDAPRVHSGTLASSEVVEIRSGAW